MADIPKTREDVAALESDAVRGISDEKTTEKIAALVSDRFTAITAPSWQKTTHYEPDTASSGEQKRREGILVLAAIATMGLATGDSSLVQVFTNSLGRLAIQLAQTVHTVARANGQIAGDDPQASRLIRHSCLLTSTNADV